MEASHPWHGPYRIVAKDETNITATRVYFPDEKSIKIHQSRVQMCPFNFPERYYWYGKKRTSPGRSPKWVEQLLSTSGTGDEHNDNAFKDQHGPDENENASMDQQGQDSPDENDCTDVTEEEVVMPVQCCNIPTFTSSQPVQRIRTRVIKPPSR